MSPSRSRTHTPSLRSMAGKRIMGGEASSVLSREDGRTLRIPSKEVGNDPQPKPLALFRMELRAHRGVVRDDGSYRAAVVGLRNEVALLRGAQMIGVHEISVQAPRAKRYALRNRMRQA